MARYRSHRHYQYRSPRRGSAAQTVGRGVLATARGIRAGYRPVKKGYRLATLPLRIGKGIYRACKG